MRRNKAPGGDRIPSGPTRVVRVAPILLAGCVGYLLGSAHIDVFRATDLSAAEAVAQRFPEDWKSASLTAATALRTAAMKIQPLKSPGIGVADALASARDAQNALFSPAPMGPAQDAAAQETIQTASADDAAMPLAAASSSVVQSASTQSAVLSAPPTQMPMQSPAAVVSQSAPATKVAAVAPRRPVNERPGYLLNDAQIASIKERLHLTPDQEQMWPAVEAALRNMAYTHMQQARGRGSAASATQAAAVDPNAVQGLKSAAVPLILSFNAEQKEEVRNLVHVMGLDQLASQF
jgi:hypothetical protein